MVKVAVFVQASDAADPGRVIAGLNSVLCRQAQGQVLPGCPIIKKGYMYSNNKPGLGIDINETAAAKYPYRVDFEGRGNDRMLDGTIVRP